MRLAARVLTIAALAAAVAGSRASAQDKPPEAPAEPEPFVPPKILEQRRKASKETGLDAAVAAGLGWLKRHGSDDGHLDCDGFDANCKGAACDGQGISTFDPGVTGLAVLAFLGAGRTQKEGDDAGFVGQALQYLMDIQDSEGCYGPRTSPRFIYNHCAAASAMIEAWWLTGDKTLEQAAQRGVGFVLKAENPYLGWRYNCPGDGDNDTSATVACALVIRTADFASLDLDRSAYTGARTWFLKMDSSALSRVGYQQRGGYDARAWSPEPPPEEPAPKPKPKPPADGEKPFKEIPLIPRIATWFQSGARGASDGLSWGGAPEKVLERYPDTKWSSLTAGAALVTALTGGAEIAPVLDRWVATVSGARPTISNGGFLDLHYLLYGSLLDAQRPFAEKPPKDAKEKKTWKTWREDAAFELVRTQRDASAGCAAGSWDPKLDPFGFAGGRIYSTAMAVLALEAPNRFPRVWDPKTKKLGPIDK